MPALLTYVRDLEDGVADFAVVTDDSQAVYVPNPNYETTIDGARLQHFMEFYKIQEPDTAQGWMDLATTNVGQVSFDGPNPVASIKDGVKEARKLLKTEIRPETAPTAWGADILDNQIEAYDESYVDNPTLLEDAQEGEDFDQEAMKNLVMMSLGPIDENGPNAWLLSDEAPPDDAYVTFPHAPVDEPAEPNEGQPNEVPAESEENE